MIRVALALFVVMLAGAVPVRASTPDGVPILMYHKIDPRTPRTPVGRSLTVDPPVFEAQLRWLQAHGIRTMTLDELVNELRAGRHPAHAVVLTFDDGYSDAATYATPLLVKYHARASFYVSAGFIGDGRHADWPQLRKMRAAGMEIGCHGTFHVDLAALTRAGADREIGHCADTLTRYLARPTTYAYAAGKWNAMIIDLMRRHGFKAALTERPGTAFSFAEPYALPRRRIARDDNLDQFAALATP